MYRWSMYILCLPPKRRNRSTRRAYEKTYYYSMNTSLSKKEDHPGEGMVNYTISHKKESVALFSLLYKNIPAKALFTLIRCELL